MDLLCHGNYTRSQLINKDEDGRLVEERRAKKLRLQPEQDKSVTTLHDHYIIIGWDVGKKKCWNRWKNDYCTKKKELCLTFSAFPSSLVYFFFSHLNITFRLWECVISSNITLFCRYIFEWYIAPSSCGLNILWMPFQRPLNGLTLQPSHNVIRLTYRSSSSNAIN